jgi:Type I restriction modification DNA specificity domain
MNDAPQAPLPEAWALPTVSEVGTVRVGRQRSPERMTGRYSTKYLRAANVGPEGLDLTEVLEMDFTPAEQDTFALHAGDVVLAEASGSASQVGRAAIWNEELPLCCIQNTVIRFRAHAALPEYALTVFRHYAASGLFARTARGVGILHLSGRRFGELPFPLPPLAEQRRIAQEVHIRSGELRRARESLQSALARTNEQDIAILAAAATGELVPTGCDRPTSQKWSTARIDEVGQVTLGKARSRTSPSGSQRRQYLRVANVLEDRIDLSDLNEMHFTPTEIEKYTLEPGDILLNEGQSPELVGRPAMYRGEQPGLCFQNALIRFRTGPTVDAEFALLIFRHYLHSGQFRRVSRRSTNIAHLSRARFAELPFPVPPLAEQRAIAKEARDRLKASAEQRSSITEALARLPAMSAELLAAAATGTLVPQHPDEGTGAQHLSLLGPPPPEKPRTIEPPDQEAAPMPTPKRTRRSRQPLAELLAERGALRLPELCKAAALDPNDIGDIETFYTMLRDEIGRTIRPIGKPTENQQLEAIDRAP